MPLMTNEKAAARRRAKLDEIRMQIAAGDLVVRTMTSAEREQWAKQHAAIEAKLTPSERARRAAALKSRRATERRLAD